MAINYNLLGGLSIQNKSPIKCAVQIKIELLDLENDEVDEKLFIDGVRLTGELSYLDSSPPSIPVKTGMGSNFDVKLSVYNSQGKDGSAEFPIIIFDRSASVEHGRDRIYFWQFTICGKPTHDSLGLLPNDFTFTTRNRAFLCRSYNNQYQTELFVVVASNRYQAKKLMKQKMNQVGNWSLEEINMDAVGVIELKKE